MIVSHALSDRDWDAVRHALTQAAETWEAEASNAIRRGYPAMAEQYREEAERCLAIRDRIYQERGDVSLARST